METTRSILDTAQITGRDWTIAPVCSHHRGEVQNSDDDLDHRLRIIGYWGLHPLRAWEGVPKNEISRECRLLILFPGLPADRGIRLSNWPAGKNFQSEPAVPLHIPALLTEVPNTIPAIRQKTRNPKHMQSQLVISPDKPPTRTTSTTCASRTQGSKAESKIGTNTGHNLRPQSFGPDPAVGDMYRWCGGSGPIGKPPRGSAPPPVTTPPWLTWLNRTPGCGRGPIGKFGPIIGIVTPGGSGCDGNPHSPPLP